MSAGWNLKFRDILVQVNALANLVSAITSGVLRAIDTNSSDFQVFDKNVEKEKRAWDARKDDIEPPKTGMI